MGPLPRLFFLTATVTSNAPSWLPFVVSLLLLYGDAVCRSCCDFHPRRFSLSPVDILPHIEKGPS